MRDGSCSEASTHAAICLGDTRSPLALEALVDGLRSHSDPSVRAGCAVGLDGLWTSPNEGLDLQRIVSGLLAALADPDAQVVRCACSVCGSVELEAARPRLLELLTHTNRAIRSSSAHALFSLGERGERLQTALERLLAEPNDESDRWGRRDWMERALTALRSPEPSSSSRTEEESRAAAVGEALRRLKQPDPEERRKAADQLHRLGGAVAVQALQGVLEDPNPGVRGTAVLALGMRKVRAALPALISHLTTDPSVAVRRMCAGFIPQFKEDRPEASVGLLQSLRDEDSIVVQGAAQGLGLLGEQSAVPELLKLLDREEWGVRKAAAWALVRLRMGDHRLVAALVKLRTEPEAAEHDLSVEEMNADLDIQREVALQYGDPEPEPALTLSELLERARELAERRHRPGLPARSPEEPTT